MSFHNFVIKKKKKTELYWYRSSLTRTVLSNGFQLSMFSKTYPILFLFWVLVPLSLSLISSTISSSPRLDRIYFLPLPPFPTFLLSLVSSDAIWLAFSSSPVKKKEKKIANPKKKKKEKKSEKQTAYAS